LRHDRENTELQRVRAEAEAKINLQNNALYLFLDILFSLTMNL